LPEYLVKSNKSCNFADFFEDTRVLGALNKEAYFAKVVNIIY